MPEPPGYLNRFQFIKWFIFNRCHHPWTLYIEFAFPPAVEAARTLLMFDAGDALRSLFRPKGNRRSRHGRKTNKKRPKRGGGIPEPTDLALGDLKEISGLNARETSNGVKALWTIDSVGQKWLGRLMIFEVVEQWLYHWALLIAANDGEPCGDMGALRAENGGGVYGPHPGTGAVAGGTLVWATGNATFGGGVVFMPYAHWFLCYSCTLHGIGNFPNPDDDAHCRVGIAAVEGDENIIWSGWETVAVNSKVDVIVTAFVRPGESVSARVLVQCIDNRVQIENDVWFAQAFA